LHADQLLRERSYPIDVTTPQRRSIRTLRLVQPKSASAYTAVIVFRVRHEHADAPNPVGLLRPRHHGHAGALPRPTMNSRRRSCDLPG
jgi:hypothetical protein